MTIHRLINASPTVTVQNKTASAKIVIASTDGSASYGCNVYDFASSWEELTDGIAGKATVQVISDTEAVFVMEDLTPKYGMVEFNNGYCIEFDADQTNENGQPLWEFYSVIFIDGGEDKSSVTRYSDYEVRWGGLSPVFEIENMNFDPSNSRISWTVKIKTTNGFDFSKLSDAHMWADLNGEK